MLRSLRILVAIFVAGLATYPPAQILCAPAQNLEADYNSGNIYELTPGGVQSSDAALKAASAILPATFAMVGGTHWFGNGLEIANNATLTGPLATLASV